MASAAIPVTIGAERLVPGLLVAATSSGLVRPAGSGSGAGPRALKVWTIGGFELSVAPTASAAVLAVSAGFSMLPAFE